MNFKNVEQFQKKNEGLYNSYPNYFNKSRIKYIKNKYVQGKMSSVEFNSKYNEDEKDEEQKDKTLIFSSKKQESTLSKYTTGQSYFQGLYGQLLIFGLGALWVYGEFFGTRK